MPTQEHPPPPNRWSYETLRNKADEFLDRHWPSGNVPIGIEHIVDVELGIDIVPVEHLLAAIEVDGYLSADRKTLYVDEAVHAHHRLHRYHFTLAHEIAHYHLHQPLFETAGYTSLEEFRRFQGILREEPYSWYEWQANCFAGLILVPASPFERVLNRAIEMAGEKGFEVDLDVEAHRDSLAEWVGRRFEVSGEVILRRGKYDGYWNFP